MYVIWCYKWMDTTKLKQILNYIAERQIDGVKFVV